MKKVLLAAVLAALIAPTAVLASSSFDGLKEGTYTGTMNSPVVKEMNGVKVDLILKKSGNDYVADVTFSDGAKETWRFNNDTLVQTEKDAKTNKPGLTYAARKTAATPNGVTYNVNCADAANKKCDADIDSRAKWTLSKDGNNGLTYKYFGVARADAFKTNVNPSDRIIIPFKMNPQAK